MIEEWLLAAIENMFVGFLFTIVSIKHLRVYRRNRLRETLLLANFFLFAGITMLVLGYFEFILQTRRKYFPPTYNLIIDILTFVFSLMLLAFLVSFIELGNIGKMITVAAVVLFPIFTFYGYSYYAGIVMSAALLVIVIVLFLYIYKLNGSIKALTFALGLTLYVISRLFTQQPMPLFLISPILVVSGGVIIFLGQMDLLTRRKMEKPVAWISKIEEKFEVR